MGRASMTRLLSLTPCHSGGVLGLHATPDASGASEPPGRLPPTPGSHRDVQGAESFFGTNPNPDSGI